MCVGGGGCVGGGVIVVCFCFVFEANIPPKLRVPIENIFPHLLHQTIQP